MEIFLCPCVKVGWIRAEDQTILALDSKVVTHNSRVGVNHDGMQTWNLHIRQVRESGSETYTTIIQNIPECNLILDNFIFTDRGCYICQVNTGMRVIN